MRRSSDRILTTHTGSLPRPSSLAQLLRAKERGEPVELSALSSLVTESVEEVVSKQCAAGVDVINDGEQSKVAYAIYVKERLSGLEDRPSAASTIEDDFP
jgi:5-methyltetrahydropteroyltriglutamate--homocysteine methyltransferase